MEHEYTAMVTADDGTDNIATCQTAQQAREWLEDVTGYNPLEDSKHVFTSRSRRFERTHYMVSDDDTWVDMVLYEIEVNQ